MSADTGRIEDALRNIQITKWVRLLFSIVVLILFAWFFMNVLNKIGFSTGEIIEYWPKFTNALSDFLPLGALFGVIPFVNVSQYWAFIQGRNLLLRLQDGNPVPGAVFVTFATGFVGTVLGIPGVLVLRVLGSERAISYPFSFILRETMSIIRAIPVLVWILIYILLDDVSPFTTTLATDTGTMGNLGCLFTDVFEEVEDEPIEATESTGASSPQKIVFGMLSQVLTPFIARMMYILKINIRVDVTTGFIGGGGFEQTLQTQHGLFRYANMMAAIFVIFTPVVSVEFVSQWVRLYIRGNEEGMSLLKLIVEFPQRMTRSIWE